MATVQDVWFFLPCPQMITSVELSAKDHHTLTDGWWMYREKKTLQIMLHLFLNCDGGDETAVFCEIVWFLIWCSDDGWWCCPTHHCKKFPFVFSRNEICWPWRPEYMMYITFAIKLSYDPWCPVWIHLPLQSLYSVLSYLILVRT